MRLALLLRADGEIVEVLSNELDLTTHLESGQSFKAVVCPSSEARAARFLRSIQRNGFALDYQLELAGPDEDISLTFSGGSSGGSLFILGTREALSRKALVQELAAIFDHYSEKRLPLAEELPLRIGSEWNTLLSAIAHDLRNPVNGLLVASQYLLYDAARLLQPEQINLLRSIESSSRAMFRMIDDLIDASALESGELTLHAEATDILELIRNDLSLCRFGAEQKSIQMDLSSAEDLPMITLDRVRFSRVIDSLLKKCIQSSQPGGRIRVSVGVEGRQAIISVHAENSFLPAAELHFLFNPGQWRDYASTGTRVTDIIAFRVANQVVERLGGSIWCESDAGKGLTFILAMPVQAARVLGQGGS